MAKYQEETGIDLFDKCFKGIIRKQALEYRISSKAVRMDSKLISSNIVWYSRYEIIHETLMKQVEKFEIEAIADQMIRQQALEFYAEDAQKTVYRTDSEMVAKRLLTLGIVIDYILTTPLSKASRSFAECSASSTRRPRTVEGKEGKKCWRYFGRDQIDKAKTRREVESIPFEERKKRSNVEATIFQYGFHTRNNKTRYRGLIKHKMQALARCAWINMRRLLLFDLEIALRRA